MIDNLVRNLESHGNIVPRFERCSAEIDSLRCGKLRAFFSGIYNPFSRRAFARFLREHAPDVVHVHNVFPLISPSILVEAHHRKIPVVMTLHNFRLVCPNGLLMRNGQVCHECLGGREHRCALHNCERHHTKSIGYALRTGIARRRRWFLDNVSHFICLTRFQRDLHLTQGFPPDRCLVIRNAVPTEFLAASPVSEKNPDSFVGSVGRLSPEKDIPALLEAAGRLSHIPFKLAGSLARMPHLPRFAPANVEFVGHLDRDALRKFYAGMRLLVFTTRCYEGLPMAPLEAMAVGLPVVCSNRGGLPELVRDGETGLLSPPDDPLQLASMIDLLWQDPDLARRMGQAAREAVLRDYHPDAIYAQHLGLYQRVLLTAADPCCFASSSSKTNAEPRTIAMPYKSC